MRRFPAILLLALFSLSLIPPVLLAGIDSKLPACCRREGLHHCAMAAPSGAGSVIQAVCPAYPKSGAAPAYFKNTGMRPAQALVSLTASQPFLPFQAQPLARIRFSRAWQKRGPPALLS